MAHPDSSPVPVSDRSSGIDYRGSGPQATTGAFGGIARATFRNPIPAARDGRQPAFSPDAVARCRRSCPGKEEPSIRPEACLLHIEDRIGGSDAVQGATYGAAAGGW